MAWTKYHDEKLKQLWDTSVRVEDIGVELGFSASYCSIKANELALPPRQIRAADAGYFQSEAKKRGLRIDQLRSALLKIIVRDHLVEAILDDRD